ncbi:MAG: trigger factor [Chitinophagaceae bacterium]|nr:trigger factor [Chitinophagaceae bacterium]MCB9044976.1 trigger factor [Chitinophagales bacterium]
MATVTRETIGKLHDKVIVKLTKEDYTPSFEKSLKQYAKNINVPGFRKGMVPSGMVRKMYGQSIFTDEVLRAAGTQVEEYLKNEKLQIFAQPMAMREGTPQTLDMNNPSDVDFTFEIGLKPEFELDALNGKKELTRYKVLVSDKLLDDEIVRLQRRFGKAEPQETVTNKEDIIYSTFEQCDADGNLVEGAAKIEDTELMDKLPVKIQELIMGKKAEDTVVIQPKAVCTEEELPVFMKDSLKLGVEAAENYYKMTLTKVSLLIPHEVNEELYAQVFQNAEVKDEASFRELLAKELGKEYDRMSRERLQSEMYELLVHSTNIDLPVDFLKRWLQEGSEKTKTAEEVEQEYPGFDHQLRWTLISDKLILENDIKVSREEVMDDIKARVLAYFGMGPEAAEDTPWMDEYMAKVMKDEKTMDETYRRLLFDKLFTFLETKFKLVDKEIDEDSFFKLQSAHDEHHHH